MVETLKGKAIRIDIKFISWEIIEKYGKSYLNSWNEISTINKLMKDRATVIYRVYQSSIIYCWWSFTRFVSPVADKLWYPCRALRRNEKRKVAAPVVFRGSMTATRPRRLRRKMKLDDKSARYEWKEECRHGWKMQSMGC